MLSNTNFDFLGKRRYAVMLSLILIVASFGSLATRGLNFGIDFTGGVVLEVGYPDAADLAGIRQTLNAAGFDDAQVQNFGSPRDVLIRLLPREGVDSGQLGQEILDTLKRTDSSVELRRDEFVGPQVGRELTENGGLAMLFATLMILAYISVRFQWKPALGSVTALVHDVVITVGVFSLFGISFDLSVLAAVLAVIGYSLNDTIVVFDRIRENCRSMRRGSMQEIMNTSINQMLKRTIVTSVTTLLVVLALLFLGGEAVRGFAIALVIGILVGTYSSIYTASTTALALGLQQADLIPPAKDEEIDEMP